MLQVADAAPSEPTVPGVDRVLWVRLRAHEGGPCDGVVHGVRHRRPVEVVVGAGVVHRLLLAGVPTIRGEA